MCSCIHPRQVKKQIGRLRIWPSGRTSGEEGGKGAGTCGVHAPNSRDKFECPGRKYLFSYTFISSLTRDWLSLLVGEMPTTTEL